MSRGSHDISIRSAPFSLARPCYGRGTRIRPIKMACHIVIDGPCTHPLLPTIPHHGGYLSFFYDVHILYGPNQGLFHHLDRDVLDCSICLMVVEWCKVAGQSVPGPPPAMHTSIHECFTTRTNDDVKLQSFPHSNSHMQYSLISPRLSVGHFPPPPRVYSRHLI